ncbi:hypothetical protein ACOSP7_019366 [Xanthoceras sorbifolium]
MEEANSCVENDKTKENENVGFVDDVDDEEDEEILKRRISSHPLYGLLIETHLNCLKVGLGDIDEVGKTNTANQASFNLQVTTPTSPELDRFMEAYCITLNKLKQAMEEPLQETTSFIDAMYIQLRELSETTHPNHLTDH